MTTGFLNIIYIYIYMQSIICLSDFCRKINVNNFIRFSFCFLFLNFDLHLSGKWKATNNLNVYQEDWFHGKMSREEVISLITKVLLFFFFVF